MPLGRLYHKVTCREKTEKAADQKREEICNDLLAKLQTEGSDLEPESGENTGIIGVKMSKRKKSGQKSTRKWTSKLTYNMISEEREWNGISEEYRGRNLNHNQEPDGCTCKK